ncbi:protein HMF1 [Dactylonectria estremocensis]|uniref:Protein HMF1 n=1 Tax=Dactylonectria estremocensis TaxID=1079267 RepID=A0A9P9EI07_9HYPO|nr:protein HMF1 [Dactylonectria estremocensis]
MASFDRVSTILAAPAAGPYSQAVKIPLSSGWIFTSGQLPAQANGNLNLDDPIGEQTRRCIKNLASILEAAGSSLDKVVKTTIFITDMKNFAEVNDVYMQYFTQKPARSCVAVKELPKGVPVEIECIALV